MKNRLKIFNSRSSSAGFTLIELLVAASITTIVVALAGSGVVAMLQSSNKAQSENLRRVELNRALDFINEEVRMAKSISKDAYTSLNTDKIAPTFVLSGKTPVLVLEIPDVSERVVYYTASSSSPWLGPKVIYRWGPTFDGDGKYTDPKTPGKWKDSLLVDLIADSKAYSNTTCPPGWSANPSSTNGQGFSACVLPYANNEPSGKIAKIKLQGQLTDGYGNSKDTLEVSTDTFARASDPLSFTTSGGTVTITQSSTADFKVLGGDAGGIPTFIDINVTPKAGTPYINNKISPSNKAPVKVGSSTNEPTLATGTTLTITGRATLFNYGGITYGGFDANSEKDKNTQVWMLRDGDTLPPFTPYPGQVPPEKYLKDNNYLENGKVKLAANQVIYLFEVTSKVKRSDYDMQDMVILATITPK